MELKTIAMTLGLVAGFWVLRRTWEALSVDHDHCPFKVETDRVDCWKPCETDPPCHHP